jgi:hypothetical protein
MITDDLYTLLTGIISLPERLGEDLCGEISQTSSSSLLRGLLGEGEASQLLLHPCRLTNTENVDGQEVAATITMIPSHTRTLS